MKSELQPYTEYRDSRMPWLGEVPQHWTEKRAKYFYREIDERSVTGEEELLSVSHKTGVTPRMQHVTMFMAENTIGHRVCRAGDLAINTMWAFMAALGVSNQTGVVSPSYGVYRPINPGELLPGFIDRLLRIDAYKAEYMCRSTGINSSRLRLYPDQFLCIPILCPPPEEQTTIVRYLDHVDRRVRRLIRAKRKLIALLTEQKQAIIHRAVTRGLNPDVPLKDSGVEWLGKVPEHWEVVTLRRVIFSAIDGPHHSPNYVDDGIPFLLSARNIKTNAWSLADVKYISEEDYVEFSKRVIPKPGDVLYTKGGTTGIARAVDLNFRFQVWVHVAVLKVIKSKILPEFLAMTLNSPRCYEQSQLFTRGATNQDLGLNRMKNIFLSLPPKTEQEEIIPNLEKELGDIDTAITHTNREIDLLNEYRTRLIADVVTGKLDVREVAARLPDEPEDGELVDESDEVEDLTEETELESED